MEYPKMLYGPKGWDELTDCRLVAGADEEEAARTAGYGDLGSAEKAPENTPDAPEAPAARRTRKAA